MKIRRNYCEYCNTTNIKNIGSHLKFCKSFNNFKEQLFSTHGTEILTKYETGISISDLKNTYKINRKFIEDCVKRLGGSLRGVTQNSQSRSLRGNKRMETLKARYGVINPGQLENSPIKLANKIPYTAPIFYKQFYEYKQEVERFTKRFIRQCKNKNQLPTHCEYTGIEFADTKRSIVNPNDWFKRTIDHRISVLQCYLNEWTVEQACVPSNLVFCLRYINTIKGNISENEFIKNYVPKLKKLLSNEN